MAKTKKTGGVTVDSEMKELLKYKTQDNTDLGFEGLKFKLKCKNEKQKEYSKLIKEKNIVICTGPAGTGKSYVALATALELLKDPSTPYKKLVLMVAPVQTDIEIGYIKGDIMAKLSPFAYSYLYNLADMIGDMEKVDELVSKGFIEIMCVSFARGVNLKDCIVIVGECQQYSKESFLTIISRPTETAKVIFEGDSYQCDNKLIRKKKEDSGLKHALSCLKGMDQIGIIEFNKSQIVRNPIITEILTRWDPDTYGDLTDIIPPQE